MDNQTFGVVLADEQTVFRLGLKALVAAAKEFELLSEATTLEEAVTLTTTLKPDVVVMDVVWTKGIEGVRKANSNTNVLVLTTKEDEASLFLALRSGAKGYLLKTAERGEILRALQAVAHGEAIISRDFAERLPALFSGVYERGFKKGFQAGLEQFTGRERDVLRLLGYQLSNKEIARQLELRPKTVRNYVSSIVGKLQLKSRHEAGRWARQEILNRQNQL
jgi:DNA-binding NarL/FixJ family response regulator